MYLRVSPLPLNQLRLRPGRRGEDQFLVLFPFQGVLGRFRLDNLADVVVFFFQQIGQNGRPGQGEAPQSTSFDETSRIKSVWARWIFGTFVIFFCKTTSARLTLFCQPRA